MRLDKLEKILIERYDTSEIVINRIENIVIHIFWAWLRIAIFSIEDKDAFSLEVYICAWSAYNQSPLFMSDRNDTRYALNLEGLLENLNYYLPNRKANQEAQDDDSCF